MILEFTLGQFTDDKEKLIINGTEGITLEKFLKSFNENIIHVYAGSTGKANRQTAEQAQEINKTKIARLFENTLRRFTQGQNLNDLVDGVLTEGDIFFLNIGTYESSINIYILGNIYKRFRSRALNLYKRKKYANAIVYVDEANRFIPQTPKDEKQKELQEKLIDGIKTTRQYGLAWWLADQRPSAISKDAFTQMGTFFFGKGMTAVADQTNMESVLGKDGCNVYSYVTTMGGSPFVATGQFIGVGSSESVAVPMQFFNNWKTLATENNKTLDANIVPPN